MKPHEWASLFIEQSSSVMTLWNVYIVVVLGLVGFIIQKGDSIRKKDIYIFMGSFFCFALSNGIPLYQAQLTLIDIHEKLSDKAIFTVTSAEVVLSIHILFDAIVLWFLYARLNSSDNKDTQLTHVSS